MKNIKFETKGTNNVGRKERRRQFSLFFGKIIFNLLIWSILPWGKGGPNGLSKKHTNSTRHPLGPKEVVVTSITVCLPHFITRVTVG